MKITLLPGDGIGVEIVDAAVEVLDAAAKKYNFTVEYDKKLIGGAAIDAFGTPLPVKFLSSSVRSVVGIFLPSLLHTKILPSASVPA